jgi:hypothetical protein
MLETLVKLMSVALLASASIAVFVWAYFRVKASSGAFLVRIGAATSDSESMDFTVTLTSDKAQREARLAEISATIAGRRQMHHDEWLKRQREAIAENEREKAEAEAKGEAYAPKMVAVPKGSSKGG